MSRANWTKWTRDRGLQEREFANMVAGLIHLSWRANSAQVPGRDLLADRYGQAGVATQERLRRVSDRYKTWAAGDAQGLDPQLVQARL